MYSIVIADPDGLLNLIELPNDKEMQANIVWDSRNKQPISQSMLDDIEDSKVIKANRASLSLQRVEATAYLKTTDWYVIRKLERSIDIPVDIQEERTIAIATLNL